MVHEEKLTKRELEVLRQIVADHRESEIESDAKAGQIVADSILAKLDRVIASAQPDPRGDDHCGGPLMSEDPATDAVLSVVRTVGTIADAILADCNITGVTFERNLARSDIMTHLLAPHLNLPHLLMEDD